MQPTKGTNRVDGAKIARGIIDLMIKFGYMEPYTRFNSSLWQKMVDTEEGRVYTILINGLNIKREQLKNATE